MTNHNLPRRIGAFEIASSNNRDVISKIIQWYGRRFPVEAHGRIASGHVVRNRYRACAAAQLGDPGAVRRALSFRSRRGRRVLADYFIEGGKPENLPFRLVPLASVKPGPRFVEPVVLGSFVEVFLAREGHGGLVGINLLEKVQLSTLPALFGAMLAGVDCVLMGAGIPPFPAFVRLALGNLLS
jgi:NAD(P)H-dependent flavin oxidoreductase YrpB (nitropropane dioxygenase family)